MRIDESSSPRPIDAAESKVKDTSPAGASGRADKTSSEAKSVDVVDLGQGRDLLKLAFEMSAVSRRGQVEEMRSKIASGDYHVNAQDVSRAIVQDLLLLAQGFLQA